MVASWQVKQEQRAAVYAEQDALMEAAEKAGGQMTPEQKGKFDALAARVTLLTQQIDSEHRDARIAAGLPPEQPEAPAPGGDVSDPARGQARGPAKYRDLFGAPAASAWQSGEEFLSVVASGLHDPRLLTGAGGVMASASSTSPSDGGFSVPSELVASWLDSSLESEVVRPRATVVPMRSRTRQVVGVDASSSASLLFGAFAGGWTAEGQEIAIETPKLKMLELTANVLAILAEIPNQLIQDGQGYTAGLEAAIVKALSWYLDLAFLTGSGAGQPRGVLNDPALITVLKEGGQNANTILYENLANMLNRLHPASVDKAIWICNQGTRAALLQLSQIIGTGGSAVPALTESGGRFRLLTLPVQFTEKVPGIGTKGDVLLCDLSQYEIGLNQDMQLASSNLPGFTRNTSHFRGLLRGDGQGLWNSAYTPKNGESLSWCVALETRG